MGNKESISQPNESNDSKYTDKSHIAHLSEDLNENTFVIMCCYDNYQGFIKLNKLETNRIKCFVNDIKHSVNEDQLLVFENKTRKEIIVALDKLVLNERFDSSEDNPYKSLILILCGIALFSNEAASETLNYGIYDVSCGDKIEVNSILKCLREFWNLEEIPISIYTHCILDMDQKTKNKIQSTEFSNKPSGTNEPIFPNIQIRKSPSTNKKDKNSTINKNDDQKESQKDSKSTL